MNISLSTKISLVFSDKYANTETTVDNVALLLMYRLAYPVAYLLNKLQLSPNFITTMSLSFTVMAFFSLTHDDGWILFSIFWGLAVLLDFCDGTIARMADKVSKTAFRYDHMSDVFKIYLVALGIGIRFDSVLCWILSATLAFSYAYSEILSHDHIARSKKASMNKLETEKLNIATNKNRIRERFAVIRYMAKEFPSILKLMKSIITILLSFNGHTLLFFFVLPVGGWLTTGTLVYLIFLTALSSISSIIKLRQINR